MPKGLQEKRAGESTKEGLGREVRQRSDVGDGREEESGMTPGLSQDSKGNILSTVETEKLKSGLSEEEGHLANFGQVYARWLNKSPPCSCPQGAHSAGGQGLVLLLSLPLPHILFQHPFLHPPLNA